MKRFGVLILFLFGRTVSAGPPPPVFPEPQEWKLAGPDFLMDEKVAIVVLSRPAEPDLRLARLLAGELSDRHRLAVRIERVASLAEGKRAVVMGTRSNPLVAAALARRRAAPPGAPRAEAYTLLVDRDGVLIAGDDEAGVFYGLQSLRQLIRSSAAGVRVPGALIRDWPLKPFRAIKIFLPGRDSLPFFRRLVSDFVALYKFNKLVVEVNAGMRFERHPELNVGAAELARDLNFTRRDRPAGPRGEYMNSVHHDTADFGLLEKDEIAEFLRWCRESHIEVIPEIASLTHSYYLLARHRELAEVQAQEWPDTYCPLLPGSYELLFDVLDEYIEVFHPRMIHVGHDEWRMPIDLCPRCKGKDPTELFIQDLGKIHAYLAKKGIRTAIWGDHLIEPLRGKRTFETGRPGARYVIPGALSPAQVIKSIPKNILIFNWFWNDLRTGDDSRRATDPTGEANDIRLEEWGFEQVYGNFKPGIQNYARRSSRRGVLGGVPSSWAATNEFNLGKDLLYEILGSAPLLWSSTWQDEPALARTIQGLMPRVRRDLSGREPASAAGDAITKISLPASSLSAGAWGAAITIETQKPGAPRRIAIGADATSIIFLHASAKPAGHDKVARYVYNAPDTSDLLGWYEVVYEDGFVESIPLRYGWNILEWNWPSSADSARYCYAADAVEAGPATFFAFEWTSPRPGKIIKEIRARGTLNATDLQGKQIAENAILLSGVSVIKARTPPAAAPR